MASDATIPAAIGRYSVERLLGAGAMGRVYLARDPKLDRAVAIKTIKRRDMDDDVRRTFLERFQNEARAAAKVHHPHIVQVFDVGEDEGEGPYLVFEYVAGRSLKQKLRAEGPMGPEEIVRFADEIAGALDAAHAAGIIHRDLKPDNLLLAPSGSAKLADFGVARLPDAALTKEGQFLGTPCYAAPETLREGRYGSSSDVFSFAATLYEVVSGKRAFPGSDAVSVAHKVIHETPKAPSLAAEGGEVPSDVDTVILHGLEKDVAMRAGSATEIAHALRIAYEDAGLVRPITRPDTTLSQRRSIPEEKGGFGGFALLLILALALGVGAVLVLAEDPPDHARDAGWTPIQNHADASVADGSVSLEAGVADGGIMDAGADAGPEDAGVGEDAGMDAGTEDAGVDAGPEDAGIGADAGTGEPGPAVDPGVLARLSRHEREERGKEALDAARDALRTGDRDAARARLREARAYDPGNPDIDALAARVDARP